MKFIFVLVFATGFCAHSFSQCPSGSCGPNLLPNSDFEITSTACGDATLPCIMYYDTSKVQGWWGTAPSSGGMTQANTPDYSNPACVGVPFGCNDFGAACSGGGHVWLAEVNYEYIQAQLLSPMQAGVSYCFTFTYRLGFNITGFGVWFHDLGKIYHSGQSIFNTQSPGITFSTEGGSGCQTATLNYTATGGETWILIGPTLMNQEITLDSLSLHEQCSATDIEDSMISASSFFISPNPATETLTIDLSKNQNHKAQLQIFNAMGMLVREVSVTQSSKIDISDLERGIYFVRLQDELQWTQKLVKE